MAKQIGEFSLKFNTFINRPGPGGILRQVTWEGVVSGFGTVFTTLIFTGGAKAGTFTDYGTAFMENGDFLHSSGQGTYESVGKHRWKTAGFFQLSDGRRISHEGEIDLAERSWKGKLFEL